MGRIYEYLNQLISLKLIEKTTKKPYYYEIKDMNKNIMDFLKHKTDEVIEAKTKLLDLMKGSGTGLIEVIDSKSSYSHHHLHIITEAKQVKIITHDRSFPLALYPQRWDDFLALRQLVRSKRDTFAFSDYNSVYLTFKTYKPEIWSNPKIPIIPGGICFMFLSYTWCGFYKIKTYYKQD